MLRDKPAQELQSGTANRLCEQRRKKGVQASLVCLEPAQLHSPRALSPRDSARFSSDLTLSKSDLQILELRITGGGEKDL
jgi:hypothetical protein